MRLSVPFLSPKRFAEHSLPAPAFQRPIAYRREPLIRIQKERMVNRFLGATLSLFAVTLLVAMGGIGLDHSPMRSLPIPFLLVLLGLIACAGVAALLFRKMRWL